MVSTISRVRRSTSPTVDVMVLSFKCLSHLITMVCIVSTITSEGRSRVIAEELPDRVRGREVLRGVSAAAVDELAGPDVASVRDGIELDPDGPAGCLGSVGFLGLVGPFGSALRPSGSRHLFASSADLTFARLPAACGLCPGAKPLAHARIVLALAMTPVVVHRRIRGAVDREHRRRRRVVAACRR